VGINTAEWTLETPATNPSHNDAMEKRAFRVIIRINQSSFHASLMTKKKIFTIL